MVGLIRQDRHGEDADELGEWIPFYLYGAESLVLRTLVRREGMGFRVGSMKVFM